MRKNPLPWHRRYNWSLIWSLYRGTAIYLFVLMVCISLLWVTSHYFSELGRGQMSRIAQAQEHQLRVRLLDDLRAITKNGQLTETDIEEGTVCMNDVIVRRIK